MYFVVDIVTSGGTKRVDKTPKTAFILTSQNHLKSNKNSVDQVARLRFEIYQGRT